MLSIVMKAMEFAKYVHRNQKRKYTGEPYFDHVSNVAELVLQEPKIKEWNVKEVSELVAAAYLHDVVEDCEVSFELLEILFGSKVSTAVYFLTNISMKNDGNREARKKNDREHNANAPLWVKLIKLADIADNTKTIQKYDPNFTRIYMREKKLLLDELAKSDPRIKMFDLWNTACKQIQEYEKSKDCSCDAVSGHD